MTKCEQCGSTIEGKPWNNYGTIMCEYCYNNYYHENPEDWEDDFI